MKYFKIILSVMVLFLCSGISWAQNGDGVGRFHSEPFSLVIGPYDGVNTNNQDVDEADAGYRASVSNYELISEHVSAVNAAWIRLKFNNVNLGDNSFITITSDADGGTQKLNSQTMEVWNYGSAIFNGNAVTLTIHIASVDRNVRLSVNEIVIGEADPNSSIPETQCGTADNRTHSTTGAIGRISPIGCTGWLIANGSFLTAGHCTGANMDILEFNVPNSLANGTTVASAPDDQYPVSAGTVFQNGPAGDGNDWAVFGVGVNSNTGLTPNEAQGSFNVFDQTFFRATRDNSATTNRVTGFGIDFVPVGSTGGNNSASQTQQTSTGGSFSETVASSTAVGINYAIDTEGGNSGSPVIMNGTINTVGIHTNGGCSTGTPIGTNSGTGFEEDDLETAIDNFNGSSDLYVDEGHPSAFASGTVLRPYKTVNAAITAAAAGTTLYIAEGGYPETVVTSKTLVIKAPVGMVVIGPNAPVAPPPPMLVEASAKTDDGASQKAEINSRWNAYPNPFITRLHIKNDEFENGDVHITLYNLLNQRVAVLTNYQYLDGNRFYENFDLSYLTKGIYTLIVEHNGKKSISKITKAE